MAHTIWTTLVSPVRVKAYDSGGRDPFQIDIDRVLFSRAFRRLGVKTQAFPLHTGVAHTRLSHSLEVASISRSLGEKVQAALSADDRLGSLPPGTFGAIMFAAGLLHDLGNPPFGHKGEEAIRSWFAEHERSHLDSVSAEHRADLVSFDANAQTFRTATRTEYSRGSGGMRLTYPVLAATVKYPWASNAEPATRKHKFGYFQDDAGTFSTVFQALGLLRGPRCLRHPLSYLLEAADDVCYMLLDIEDAYELGILEIGQVRAIVDGVLKDRPKLMTKFRNTILFQDRRPFEHDHRSNVCLRLGHFRSDAVSFFLEHAVEAFLTHYDAIMAGDFQGDLLARSAAASQCAFLREMLDGHVYSALAFSKVAIGAHHILGTILDCFCDAALLTHLGATLPDHARQALGVLAHAGAVRNNAEQPGTPSSCADPTSLYHRYLCVLDYASGLTDVQASKCAQDVRGDWSEIHIHI